jgi:hypothetical protein
VTESVREDGVDEEKPPKSRKGREQGRVCDRSAAAGTVPVREGRRRDGADGTERNWRIDHLLAWPAA